MNLTRTLFVLALLPLAACSGSRLSTRESVAIEAMQRPGELRMMTFNIQWARRGIDGVVATIAKAKPDLVALQEVDLNTRRSNQTDQTAELARLAGYPHYAFFPAMDRDGGKYGTALLSRFPILGHHSTGLPNLPNVEPRAVGRAWVKTDAGVVSVYVTHLAHMPHHASLRVLQMRKILALMREDPRPKVLMGDLNDTAGSRVVRLASQSLRDVFAAAGKGPSGTFPLPLFFLPDPTFDYVLVSGEMKPKSGYVLRSDASDHYPVVTEVMFGNPGDAPATASASR